MTNKEMLSFMKIKFILLFVFCYLFFLVTTLPAGTVMRFIPKNSGINVAAVSGTLWHGKAHQLTYNKHYHLQQMDWKVDWFALSTLQLKLDITFHNGHQAMTGNASLLLGFSGMSAENVDIDLPAPELLSYLNLSLPVNAQGNLALDIKKASLGKPYCRKLDGQLTWKNAKINSELGNIDLETANADLSCKNGQLVADLQQTSEQLNSTFKFTLKAQGAYQLQGHLKAGDKLAPALQDALSWIGTKNSAGEIPLNFNGVL